MAKIIVEGSDFHNILVAHGFRHIDHRKAGYYEPGMPETYEINHKDVGHTVKVHRDNSWDHYSRETGALRHVTHGHDYDSLVNHIVKVIKK